MEKTEKSYEEFDEKLDEKDLQVLAEITENAKRTTSQISKRINIPITTVHNRIKKLEKLGIIKKYTVNVDHAKLGKPISSYVMVSVVYMLPSGIKVSQEDVAKHVKGITGVESVEIMTGETDLLVKVRVKDIAELNDFVIRKLRKVEGVDKTRTMIVLSEV
jgi:DNA-binding Lrp family transcriptional regulator